MDEYIGISTLTETVTDDGGTTESWSVPTADVPAKVRFINTNEADPGVKQEKFVTEIKIHTRYYSAFTETKKVYWRSKYYDVYAIEFTPKARFMVMKARLIET